MVNQYRRLPNQGGTPREVAEVVNNLVEGKLNSTGTVTLATGGATTTTLLDRRIGADSVILFAPASLSAAATKYPQGIFETLADITFTTANTPQVLTLNLASGSPDPYGMSVASNKITVDYAGTYDISISALFVNQDVQIHECYLWYRVNGTDVPHSATKFSVVESHGGVDGYMPVHINHQIDLSADDYVEIVGAVATTDVYLEYYAAQTTPFARPSIPSLVVEVNMLNPSKGVGSAFDMYVSGRQKGQATINHLPNSISGKTYDYVIIG